MKKTTSIQMLETLQKAKAQLSNDARQQICDFVSSQMTEEQSFRNKGGQPDLYYTVFGWMLCYVLGIRLDAKKMKAFLDAQQPEELDLIHYAAYQRCSILADLFQKGKVRTWLSSLKTKKIKKLSSFTGIPHNDTKSPYSKFIWLALLEDSGNKLPDQDSFLAELQQYHLPEGGYRNLAEGLGATTNATVAALSVIGQLTGFSSNSDVEFLKTFQHENGGFYATTSSPVPDLLSTATALFMLQCYNEEPKFHPGEFLEAHWLESGGFCPTLVDETSDVEYTFYGLLALGTLN